MKLLHLRKHRESAGLKRKELERRAEVPYWKLDALERGRDTDLTEQEWARLQRILPNVLKEPERPAQKLEPASAIETMIMGLPNRDERTERMAGVVARVVAGAIHETLAKDELSRTKAGQIAIAEGLDQLAASWSRERLDVSGLIAIASLLRRGVL